MKFLKSTVAIVALLAIGSVSAKVMTKKVQPAVIANDEINTYIDEIFNNNYDDMVSILLDNYNKKDISELITELGLLIVDRFPNNIPTAKQLFRSKIMVFCEDIKDPSKKTFIRQSVDKSMMTSAGTRQMRRTNRLNK